MKLVILKVIIILNNAQWNNFATGRAFCAGGGDVSAVVLFVTSDKVGMYCQMNTWSTMLWPPYSKAQVSHPTVRPFSMN